MLAALAVVSACLDPNAPGALVPPTVDQDPDLPSATIRVAGHDRQIHVRTFGDASQPTLMVVHASASDLRFYLPLRVLADRYHVILWDMRGNGLSERVPAEELAFSVMADELLAVEAMFSPDRPVTLIAHSWGAAIAVLFMAKHPELVHQAVLIEPPGLKAAFAEKVGLALDLVAPGYLDMVWSTDLLAPSDHETLDYKTLMMVNSGVRNLFCDPDHRPPLPVWRLGGLALAVWESEVMDGTGFSYDFTPGLEDFPRKVLLVGTECSPIGTDFQRETNLTVFPDAEVVDIRDSGHRLITEKFDAFMEHVNAYLEPNP